MNDQNCANILGPYVQKLREERGWSLEDLTEEFARQGITVSPQKLERIESQQDELTDLDVMAFAYVFKTDVTSLYAPHPTPPEVLEGLRRMIQNARPLEDRDSFVLESLSMSYESEQDE